jgi:CrcB protein
MNLVWLMLAGALGTLVRYSLTLAIQNWLSARGGRVLWGLGGQFPMATLLINVCGSFLLAVLATLALQGMVKPELRLILGTGFLGAFTTFSTFELESHHLMTQGSAFAATIYIGGNLLLGYAAIFAGRAVALRFSS